MEVAYNSRWDALMAERRVPAWFVAVGRDAHAERIYEIFRSVLVNLPMSASDLARRLRVSQPTVSRWTTGAARPSLGEMTGALEIIDDYLAGLHGKLRYLERVLDVVQEAVEAARSKGGGDDELRAVRRQLHDLLAAP